jgi:hypothetical protein
MNATDKKKTMLLGLLVVLAGVSWYFVFSPIMFPSTGSVPANSGGPGRSKPFKVVPSAVINLSLLEKPSESEVGQRNLFVYPPKAPPKPTVTPVAAPPSPPQPIQPSVPVTPPQPPFRAFKYEGMSVKKDSGRILAAISEGGNVYQLEQGECIQGTYCINRLSETEVEIEEIQQNQQRRRQTFRRVTS